MCWGRGSCVVVVVGIVVAISMTVRVIMAVHTPGPVLTPCTFGAPAVVAAAARVHEEVGDRGELETQLLGDGDLHLFGGSPVFPKDCGQCAALQVGKDQSLFLGKHVSLPSLVLFLPFTC